MMTPIAPRTVAIEGRVYAAHYIEASFRQARARRRTATPGRKRGTSSRAPTVFRHLKTFVLPRPARVSSCPKDHRWY